MSEPKHLTFHDHCIRAIGYGALVIPGLALLAMASALLNQGATLRFGEWALAAMIVAVCLSVMAFGHWIIGKYQTGKRSGF